MFYLGNSSGLCSVYGYPTGVVSSVQETILNCVLYMDIHQEYCTVFCLETILNCILSLDPTGILNSV